MLLEAQSEEDRTLAVPVSTPDIYIAPLDPLLAPTAFQLLKAFRGLGLKADMNHTTRGLRAQFKYADKLQAAFVAILGEDEAKKGVVKIRNMKSGEEWELRLSDAPQKLADQIAAQRREEVTP